MSILPSFLYNVDMSLEISSNNSKSGKRVGCWLAGAIAGGIVLLIVGFFSYRILFYYQKIKAGEISDLPQFTSKVTRLKNSSVISAVSSEQLIKLINSDTASVYGSKDAKLTIVQFSDFECPFSKEVAPAFRTISLKYQDKIRVIYRNFPIESIHPGAPRAAEAGECAGEQSKFQEYYDKLFLNQDALDYGDLLRYGVEVGLDSGKFSSCLASGKYKAKVAKDLADGVAAGVEGTPTFFFNGQKIEGSIPEAVFDDLVVKFLGK